MDVWLSFDTTEQQIANTGQTTRKRLRGSLFEWRDEGREGISFCLRRINLIMDVPVFPLRDDGANGDLGYPWAAVLPDGRVLVVYYMNIADGTRHIAGSLVEIR